MLNRVVLIGRLTADPTLKYTPSGKAVAQFTLAVGRRFKKEETDFFRSKFGENLRRQLHNT